MFSNTTRKLELVKSYG